MWLSAATYRIAKPAALHNYPVLYCKGFVLFILSLISGGREGN
jgi:hypothetical protein